MYRISGWKWTQKVTKRLRRENFVVVEPVVSPSVPMVEMGKTVEPEAVEDVTTMEPVVLPLLRFMWSRKLHQPLRREEVMETRVIGTEGPKEGLVIVDVVSPSVTMLQMEKAVERGAMEQKLLYRPTFPSCC